MGEKGACWLLDRHNGNLGETNGAWVVPEVLSHREQSQLWPQGNKDSNPAS